MGGMRAGDRKDTFEAEISEGGEAHLRRLKGGSNLLYYIIILPSLPYGCEASKAY